MLNDNDISKFEEKIGYVFIFSTTYPCRMKKVVVSYIDTSHVRKFREN